MATLTPATDFNPVPRISVTVVTADLPATTNFITLYRMVDGRLFEVRGAINVSFLTSKTFVDLEAPFGVATQYVADAYNGSTRLSRVTIGTATLSFTGTVVQQPLDPKLFARVQELEATASTLTRRTPAQVLYPQGRVLPSVIATGPRRGLEGVTLQFVVDTAAEANLLQASLGTYTSTQLPVWLVRTAPPIRLPRLFFCHVPELVEEDLTRSNATLRFIRFTATVDEIAPPAPGLIVPFLQYDDLDAGYATYTLRDAAYASYAASDSDWSLANLVP